jgi:uncharacterized membrane protein
MSDFGVLLGRVIIACLAVPLAGAQITYTTIDVPGAVVTGVEGINTNGDMVGYYATSSNGPSHGFVLRSGTMTSFDYPGASSTIGTGINDSGMIVGYADYGAFGFVYDGITFTKISFPHSELTSIRGINNLGDIVGGVNTDFGHGFELQRGRVKSITPPGTYVGAYASSVNNVGVIVGTVVDGLDARGFVYKHGLFKRVGFPGAEQTTYALGINDDGTVVGAYQVGAFFYGFALTGVTYTTLSVPSAILTFAVGINAGGQVVGSYDLNDQIQHGFVSSPIP